MSHYYLPAHVHCCQTEDAIVFLDLKRDRYFGLESRWDILVSVLDGACRDECALAVQKCLFEQGLLTTEQEDGHLPNVPAVAHGLETLIDTDFDALNGVRAEIRLHHFANLAFAHVAARILRRFCSLQGVIEHVRRNQMRASPSKEGDLRALVRAFLHLRPLFYVAQRHCMLDSLTLLNYLARYGHSATWVLGVKTRTFAAHAWVQKDAFVLNDSPEHIRQFVPILAI